MADTCKKPRVPRLVAAPETAASAAASAMLEGRDGWCKEKGDGAGGAEAERDETARDGTGRDRTGTHSGGRDQVNGGASFRLIGAGRIAAPAARRSIVSQPAG